MKTNMTSTELFVPFVIFVVIKNENDIGITNAQSEILLDSNIQP